jgi:acetyl-CoA acyltransferase
MNPLILGAADAVADDFDKEAYKAKNGPEKIDALLGAAVNRLFDFLEFHPHAARELITDLIGFGPPVTGEYVFFDTSRKAASLGLTGVRAHTIDLGGASVGASLHQATSIIRRDPDAIVLIAGADIPRSAYPALELMRQTNRAAAHPEHEAPCGATLIGLYALMARRFMHDGGVTREDLRAVTSYYRERAAGVPRAVNHSRTLRDEDFNLVIADPYCPAMSAVVTDHGFATLVMGEARYAHLSSSGILRADVPRVYIAGTGISLHSEFCVCKGDLSSAAGMAAREAFADADAGPEEVEYAWIYDCFTHMLPMQAARYFGIEAAVAARGLSGGHIDTGDRRVPVNDCGGLLNYRAAMMISGATGLVDVMNRYGLCATLPVPGRPQPALALMGGNGGIDSVNSVVLFSTTPRHAEERDPFPRRKDVFLNRIGCDEDEEGRVCASTTVNFNPDGPFPAPYVLALVRFERDRVVMANLCDASGALLVSDAGVVFDLTRVVMRRDGPRWKACVRG